MSNLDDVRSAIEAADNEPHDPATDALIRAVSLLVRAVADMEKRLESVAREASAGADGGRRYR